MRIWKCEQPAASRRDIAYHVNAFHHSAISLLLFRYSSGYGSIANGWPLAKPVSIIPQITSKRMDQ
jgi:hypothetical protein